MIIFYNRNRMNQFIFPRRNMEESSFRKPEKRCPCLLSSQVPLYICEVMRRSAKESFVGGHSFVIVYPCWSEQYRYNLTWYNLIQNCPAEKQKFYCICSKVNQSVLYRWIGIKWIKLWNSSIFKNKSTKLHILWKKFKFYLGANTYNFFYCMYIWNQFLKHVACFFSHIVFVSISNIHFKRFADFCR